MYLLDKRKSQFTMLRNWTFKVFLEQKDVIKVGWPIHFDIEWKESISNDFQMMIYIYWYMNDRFSMLRNEVFDVKIEHEGELECFSMHVIIQSEGNDIKS